ncbi:retention module-containing protein [Achromobacter sp.]|uniref:retention module-containing protein n=1 Tax=Achromobacter sp. TaxID=134375 RepID=UPI003C78131A
MADTSPAIVNEISGRAWLRHGDGSLTELHQGSKVPAGSDIVTASGATVSLQVENGMPIVIGEDRMVALTNEMTATLDDPSEAALAPPSGTDSDRLLAVLLDSRDLFDELDPTAAALAGGGGDGGSSFVRLARLLETTSPLDLTYSNPSRSDMNLPRMSGAGAISNDDDEPPTPVSVNTAPGARDDAGLGDQNSQVRGNLLANDADPDGDPLAITSVGGRSMTSDGVVVAGSNGGTFTVLADGSYVYEPGDEYEHLAAGEAATSTVSYTIADPSGATSTATVVVTIAGTNDGPVSTAISSISSVDAQTDISYDVSGHFSDPDASDQLTYTAAGLPPGLSIDPITGIISGDISHSASQGGIEGRYTATVTATDASGATTSQELHWNVTNAMPAAAGDAGATDEDTPLTVGARYGVLTNDSDPDGDTLTVSHVNGSAASVGAAIAGTHGGMFTLNADGSYIFSPGSAFQHLGVGEKAYSSITYSVSDGEGGTTSATLSVEVVGTNDAPILQAQINPILEDHAASGNVLTGAVDVDNDTLTITTFTVNGAKYAAGNTAYLAGMGSVLVNADGSYTFTPDSNWNGDVPQVTYTATDGTTTISSTLDIHVLPVNDAPVTLDGSGNVAAGNSYVFGMNDFPFSDPGEGHSMLSVIIDSLPTGGTLSLDGKPVVQGQEISAKDLAGGKLVFDPDTSNTGASAGASLEFRVKDNGGSTDGGEDRSDQQTFKVHVDQFLDSYNGNETVSGGSGNDVLLGDQGGMAKNVIAGTSYNIALLLDLSYSMGWTNSSNPDGDTALDAAKKALKHLLESQLATHEGTINVSLITFNDEDIRVQKSISDLTPDNVDEIVSSLLHLETGPNTPYGAALHETKKWFDGQPTVDDHGNPYKNLTYFLTDGEPTPEKNYDADAEFNKLAEISDVHAIGVGSRIFQGRLDNFDNTGGWFTNSSGHIKQINFDGDWVEGADDPARWQREGDGTVERPTYTSRGSWGHFTSGKMALTDTTADGQSFTVTMNVADKITITNPTGASFRFDLWLYNKGPVDTFKWILLKWSGSEWVAVESGTEAATQTDSYYGPGDYLFQFVLNDNSPTDDQLHAQIGGIYTSTENRRGGSQIVRDPSELTATLTGNQSSNEAASVGDDKIHAGDGSDILFGDSINTDRLPWGLDGTPAQPADLPAGSGLDALKQFLLLKNGIQPTDADLHKFISDNHALFDVQGDTRGGNDELHGGAGNDILYGQGGSDLLHGDEGNDVLSGGTGNDTLFGDAGNDVLLGGKSNDILYGGSGSDTFKWLLNDQGAAGTSAVDTIKDFSVLKPADGGDILDLQGLLVGEDDGSLAQYLNFHKEGNDTVIDVHTRGKLSAQGSDQKIVLENVDLTHDTYGQLMNNQAIINDLLQKGKLIVDHG